MVARCHGALNFLELLDGGQGDDLFFQESPREKEFTQQFPLTTVPIAFFQQGEGPR
jgi:hypothetical protein